MDQEFVDNKITKDLAHSDTIPAIELPSLNIITTLSSCDVEYIENEVIPYSILKNIENKFEDFSEEWIEYFQGIEKREVSKSSKIEFKFYLLQNQNVSFRNKLITNTYQSNDNYQIRVNEYRNEVILTDGEVLKNDKKEMKTSDEHFFEKHQDLQILNASYIVVIERNKRVTPFGRWEHHDTIKVYMIDRMKIDYLRMYIGSKF